MMFFFYDRAVYYTVGILYEVYYTTAEKSGILYDNRKTVYYTEATSGILYKNGRKTRRGILYKECGCGFVQF